MDFPVSFEAVLSIHYRHSDAAIERALPTGFFDP
jgi:hypothetical protein